MIYWKVKNRTYTKFMIDSQYSLFFVCNVHGLFVSTLPLFTVVTF
jgi:hypothetical protein